MGWLAHAPLGLQRRPARRRPDHYKQFMVVGIILMALLGRLGWRLPPVTSRVAEVPSALTNPAYILLAIAFELGSSAPRC
jgi:hypothetical protein